MRPPAWTNSLNPYTRGQLILHGKLHDLYTVRRENHVIELDEGACPARLAEDAFEIAGVPDGQELQLDSERSCSKFRLLQVLGISRIHGVERRDAGHRNGLPQQFQSLPHQIRVDPGSPVTFPPGRARLATIPVAPGSMEATKTIGMVWVALLATGTGGVPDARSTSTLRRSQMSSRLGEPIRAIRDPYSMLMFGPPHIRGRAGPAAARR